METEIGKVIRFFTKPSVAAIEITSGTLKVGDQIRIKGHTTDFTQTLESMQIDNKPVSEAGVGDTVGIKTPQRVREHDVVSKVTGDG